MEEVLDTLRLQGKVALVTGGAMGIGRSIVEIFAQEGAQVVSIDIEEEQGSAVARELSGKGYAVDFQRADVTCQDDLDRVFAIIASRHQALDIVVNNAGVIITRGIMKATLDDWEQCVAVDLKSIWQIAQRAVPLMQRRGGGSIVNLSSMHGIHTSAGSFPYSTVKTAVIGLTRTMAVDLGQYGIRVNAICPGLIETRMSIDWTRNLKLTNRWKKLMDQHPLRRSGSPEDVARVALFFASGDSSFITGTHLFVDGGHHAVIWNFSD